MTTKEERERNKRVRLALLNSGNFEAYRKFINVPKENKKKRKVRVVNEELKQIKKYIRMNIYRKSAAKIAEELNVEEELVLSTIKANNFHASKFYEYRGKFGTIGQLSEETGRSVPAINGEKYQHPEMFKEIEADYAKGWQG